MQKTTALIAIIIFLLSGCKPASPELTKSEIRATKQAEKKALRVELTRQPNFQPETPILISSQDEIIKNGSTCSFRVMLDDPENDQMKVTAYARPRTATNEPFKIVILPDTQIYAMYYPEIAIDQTEWIMANRENENIVAVAHLGDSVHVGKDNRQWANAYQAILVLGEELPYGIVVGNHDQIPKDEPENSTEIFNHFFGVDFFENRPYFGGHYGDNNDNSFIKFNASGLDFVMLFLEFDKEPNFEVMEWAKKVLRDHPDHFGIVVVHSLLFSNGSWTPQGWFVYKEFRNLPNVMLMTSGHIPGESRRQDEFRENTIHTMLSDFQEEEMGGEGKLRIWEFLPEDDVLNVTTYSPTLDKFQTTEDSQFSLELDIDHPFMEIFTKDNVPSGTEIEIPFRDLVSGTTYDWYVIVEDEYSLVKSPVWIFTVD